MNRERQYSEISYFTFAVVLLGACSPNIIGGTPGDSESKVDIDFCLDSVWDKYDDSGDGTSALPFLKMGGLSLSGIIQVVVKLKFVNGFVVQVTKSFSNNIA